MAAERERQPAGADGAPDDEEMATTRADPPSSDAQAGEAGEPTLPTTRGTSDSRSRGGSGSTLSAATLHETLELQDVARTRAFLRVSAAVALACGAPLPWLRGDPLIKALFAASLTAIVIANLVLDRRLRDPHAYRAVAIGVVAAVCVGGALGGIAFFGAFSPAAVVVPFGLYFFGLARSFGGTFATYLACAIGYLALSLPAAAGLWPDRGLLGGRGLTGLEATIIIATVEVIFAATFASARMSRRATELALEQHDRAVQALAGREALLAEARLDLEGMLRARGLGRFTGEMLGRYRIGELIGRGGMGEVYEAVDVDSEAVVALKLLHPHLLSEPASEQRFLRESELAASLRVPNVVAVLDRSGPGAAVPYIAMERLRGKDLAEILRERSRLGMRETIELIREIGHGLDAARRAGIVHRDIKPRNLFRAEQQDGTVRWKILDFGVSKLASEATLGTHHIVGTPSYMAPEQARGDELSHRTDLFSLGVIGYRALTGRPAFSGDGLESILFDVLTRMPPRPSEAASRLSSDVDLVLAIALAKDPWERFDSAAELADALENAARSRLPNALRDRARRLLDEHPWP